ncbi:MAG: thioesterase family protein [Acidobacteriota bacterium]
MTPPRERFHETRIDVRFHEVDSYDVVWHGHYVAWLEVARGELARAFGIAHERLAERGYMIPIVSLRLDYKAPARQGDAVVVGARLREPRTAMLELDYEVRHSGGQLLATAESRQVVLNGSGELLVTLPSVVKEAVARIRAFHAGG